MWLKGELHTREWRKRSPWLTCYKDLMLRLCFKKKRKRMILSVCKKKTLKFISLIIKERHLEGLWGLLSALFLRIHSLLI